jgi:PAS domain S-box-containing protein
MKISSGYNAVAACLQRGENLSAIFDAVLDGIVMMDRNLKVASVNQAAQDFFGVTQSEMAAGDFCCSEILADIHEILVKSVSDERPIKNYSVKLTDSLDDERTVILSTALLRDNNSAVTGIALILHDISEVLTLQRKLEGSSGYYKLIGRNRKMLEVYGLIEKVARSEAPILIEGESGVGKGIVAEAIHRKSNRRDGPFIKVNCAALSETLLESELFGHVKGAFTGALRDRIGRFELANNGVIFLDEIGEVSHATQLKLLTILQDKIVERVGDAIGRKVDVRIISATNKKLKSLVDSGIFREDLYYRLKVVRIDIPPLRERSDDIPLLIDSFVARQREETGKPITGLQSEALKLLTRYRWPGNIRELENAIAQAFVLCDDPLITPRDLPEEIVSFQSAISYTVSTAISSDERTRIMESLARNKGKKSSTATELGIDRTTLWRKMKQFNLT